MKRNNTPLEVLIDGQLVSAQVASGTVFFFWRGFHLCVYGVAMWRTTFGRYA